MLQVVLETYTGLVAYDKEREDSKLVHVHIVNYLMYRCMLLLHVLLLYAVSR